MTRGAPTTSSHPSGISGSAYATAVDTAVGELFKQFGGILKNVAGTNTITADVQYSTGFSAYDEPLVCEFLPVATNTGVCTINLNGLGSRSIKRPDGTELQAGDIVIDVWARLIFVNSANEFVLVSFKDIPTNLQNPIKKVWTVNIDLEPTDVETRTVFTLPNLTAATGDVLQLRARDLQYGKNDDLASLAGEELEDAPREMLMPYNSNTAGESRYGVAYAEEDAGLVGGGTYDVNWMVDGSLDHKMLTFQISAGGNTVAGNINLNNAGAYAQDPFSYQIADDAEHDYTIEVDWSDAVAYTTGKYTVGARWYGEVILYTPTGLITG